MESYHVYFSPKKDVSKEVLIGKVREFMETQLAGNLAREYRILEMKNKASFQEIPDFHLIVNYESEAELQEAFKKMKQVYQEDPHAPLMSMVSEFRVAFSTDIGRDTEPDGVPNPVPLRTTGLNTSTFEE